MRYLLLLVLVGCAGKVDKESAEFAKANPKIQNLKIQSTIADRVLNFSISTGDRVVMYFSTGDSMIFQTDTLHTIQR